MAAKVWMLLNGGDHIVDLTVVSMVIIRLSYGKAGGGGGGARGGGGGAGRLFIRWISC